MTVDHPLISVAHAARGDAGGVRAAVVRLGEREGAANMACQQRFQPALALGGRGAHGEELCITGIRGLAAENLRGEHASPQHLVDQRERELALAATTVLGREMRGPQPTRFHLVLVRLPEGIEPALVKALTRDLQRQHHLVDVLADPVEFGLECRIGSEIPTHVAPRVPGG